MILRYLVLAGMSLLDAQLCAETTNVPQGWVTVRPPEFVDGINNPLKGYRQHKSNGYGLLERQYIEWNKVEQGAGDSVDRIIAHTNKITQSHGKRFEDLNVKLVPRVYLDWNGEIDSNKSQQHWPSDLHTFDYDSPAFQQRMQTLIAKLGLAWDQDPRIFAVQMGFIGRWGEHHSPSPTIAQRRLLTDAFKRAFKNKPVLVRHNDSEFMEAKFGIYYDTFATITREPPNGPKDQFPWQAMNVHRDIWKNSPMEGEVEYNWQKQRGDAKAEQTFGRTPDETMTVPAYRNFMIDKIRRYHTSYLGWITDYDASKKDVLAGAGELQKAFGYRFVIDSLSYPAESQPGTKISIHLNVRNTGSAPFYLDWPVMVALLDPATKKPVWSAPLHGMDVRKWLPGEDWDSDAFAYRVPAAIHQAKGTADLPRELPKGSYILALAIADRQGGMLPSARFATTHYFRGGWHPLGYIGIGAKPESTSVDALQFDSPAFDDSLRYIVPEKFRAVKSPADLPVKAVKTWKADPLVELINPARYWSPDQSGGKVEKQILNDGGRIIRLSGDFSRGTGLNYDFGNGFKLAQGVYQFKFRARGTPDQKLHLVLADDWREVSKFGEFLLTKEWKEHSIDLEIKNDFKDESALRLSSSGNFKGVFDLSQSHMKKIQPK
jgi:Domain of unknown function (DUF4832)